MPDDALPTITERVVDEDWSLDDLTDRTFEGVEFVGVDLAETTSTGGLVFNGCVFRDLGFDLAVHTSAAFVNCVFTGCRFTNARFVECKFVGSRFRRCEFARTTVERGDWGFVVLAGAKLGTAHFDGVRLREADLTGIDATGGVLRGCDLVSVSIERARLDRCDLRGSDFSTLDPWAVTLAGAKVTWEQAVVLARGFGLDVQPD